MRGFGALPFPAAVALFAALIVAGIYLDFHWGGVWVLIAAVAAVAVLASLYLLDYSRRPIAVRPPVEGPPGATATTPADDVPFDDPVIEADQIASGEVLPGVIESPAESPTNPEEAPAPVSEVETAPAPDVATPP